MLCDGSVVGVVLDEHGKPVSVGTKTRVPSTKMQRAVVVRDGRLCTYPGCGRPAEETHHIVHWVVGRCTAVEILTSGGSLVTVDLTTRPSTSSPRSPRLASSCCARIRLPALAVTTAETAGSASDGSARRPDLPATWLAPRTPLAPVGRSPPSTRCR